MDYSKFHDLTEIKKVFGIKIEHRKNFYSTVDAVKISERLADFLQDSVPLALAIDTEKARSEFIIAPVLLELYRRCNNQISIFSGVEFNIDNERGLNGVCDFIISHSPEQFELNAPVISIVEAKPDNVKDGLPQCSAAMIAARLFNEREKTGIATIHGVVTTGNLWKFLKFEEQTIFVDMEEYHIKDELGKILGILVQMAGILE